MAAFEINYDEAVVLGTLMNTSGDDIIDEVVNLENRLMEHMDTWNGDAKNAYRVAKEQWDAGLAKQREALAELGRLLNVNLENYNDTDTANARKFGI